jgi:Na+-driven multidrug efflux pump
MASQPIIGFNFGAKSVSRIRETLRISLTAATIIAVVAFAITEAIPGTIIKLFNNDSEELFNITIRGLRLMLLALPIIGFQIVASNFFQAVGKAKLAMFATLFRQIIALIPLLLVLPGFWGVDGIWLSYPISDSMSAVVVGLILWREWKRLPESVGEVSK